MNLLPDYAAAYDVAGWVIIPMVPRTKKALVKWKEITEPDPVRTDRYWQWRPDASIGVLCGPSQLVVVDVDVPGAESVLPPLPPTATVTTGRGTHHIYQARAGSPIRNTTGRVPVNGEWVETPGVDLRGAGGLFVAPPSIHKTGIEYTWDKAVDLEFAPSWLRYPEPVRRTGGIWCGSNGQATARVEALIDVVPTAAEGERNSCLNWAAFQMREVVAAGAMTEAEALAILTEAGLAAGLDLDEVEATAISGLQARTVEVTA